MLTLIWFFKVPLFTFTHIAVAVLVKPRPRYLPQRELRRSHSPVDSGPGFLIYNTLSAPGSPGMDLNRVLGGERRER